MHKWQTCLAITLATALAACQHSPDQASEQVQANQSPKISTAPLLPDSFDKYAEAHMLEIPVEMISLAQVARPRAPIRSGPGANLPLTDWMLAQGERVLTFDRVGRWVRVLALKSGHRGWLHEGVLAPVNATSLKSLTLNSALLPTAFAQHHISRVESYAGRTGVKANIPRGAAFRALMIESDHSLVLVPQTNAVVWVNRKDVQ